MDENLRSRIPSSDQRKGDEIETSFVITGEVNSSTDLVATIPSDNQMAESLSTKWTNEKHKLFLSSMEASFIKQLYSHDESRSMNMLDWSSRGRTKPDPSTPGPSSSGQFKVLQSGHWKQLNFDSPQPRLAVVNESPPPALPENHWIERYRPGRKHREVTSPKMEEENAGSPCSNDLDEAVHHLGGNKTATTTTVVTATSSKRFSNCHSHLYHKESVGSSTAEVSDQNFPIEDHKGEKLSSFSRAERIKTTSVDDSTGVNDSNKDQVVPTVESPVMAVLPCRNVFQLGQELGFLQTAKSDGFGCLRTGSSYFVEQELHEGVYKAETEVCTYARFRYRERDAD